MKLISPLSIVRDCGDQSFLPAETAELERKINAVEYLNLNRYSKVKDMCEWI